MPAITTDPTAAPFGADSRIAAALDSGEPGITLFALGPPGEQCFVNATSIVLDGRGPLQHALPTELSLGQDSFQGVLLHEVMHAWGLGHPADGYEPAAPTLMDPRTHNAGNAGDPVVAPSTMRITGQEHRYLRTLRPTRGGGGDNLMLHRFARPHETCWDDSLYALPAEAAVGSREVWTAAQVDCYPYDYWDELCESHPNPSLPLNTLIFPTDITVSLISRDPESLATEVRYALVPTRDPPCELGIELGVVPVVVDSEQPVLLGLESLQAIPEWMGGYGLLEIPRSFIDPDEDYEDFYLCAHIDPDDVVDELSANDNAIVSERHLRVWRDTVGHCC